MQLLKRLLCAAKGLSLVFCDEFKNSTLSESTFNIEEWKGVNNQLQTYSKENILVQNGILDILVTQTGSERNGYVYKSGRINTIGKLEITCGSKIVIKAKLPVTAGMWPALWLFYPHADKYAEIDIMELVDEDPNKIWASVHSGKTEDSLTSVTESYTLPNGTFTDYFHTFTLDWRENRMQFYVDEKKIWSVTPETFVNKTSGEPGEWVFNDISMALIMNVAVGGDWPQFPASEGTYPQHMLVESVKVYR